MKTVAVIQPYFVPYAGYFRLFAAADAVVLFDCVQFPRRGWVHRNRLPLAGGTTGWLTLPLEKAPFDARISDLRFPSDARARLSAAMRRFPLLERALRERAPIVERVLDIHGSEVTPYLCGLVNDVAVDLGLQKPTIRSSELHLAPELHGQDRVIAAVKAVGGTRYVNPSGGRELYDHPAFAAVGLELFFLAPYRGGTESILARLLCEPAAEIAAEIVRESILEP